MVPQPPFAPHEFEKLGEYLRGIDAAIGIRPKAILVISGHWEEAMPTVNTGEAPPLYFDYSGFPEHTYHLKYPAPGLPKLAHHVAQLLNDAGIASAENNQRGFDHGIFVPFMQIYPDADVPIVQLSLLQDMDPAVHIKIGQALQPLRDEGVLIVGSGLSYHNLRSIFRHGDSTPSHEFDAWLTDAVSNPSSERRNRKLIEWEHAPYAREAHPREEHLMPLMVVAGAAGDDIGRQVYSDTMAGKAVSAYQFG